MEIARHGASLGYVARLVSKKQSKIKEKGNLIQL
jgi:hypothetical protein